MSVETKGKDLRKMEQQITPGSKQPWVVWLEDDHGQLCHPKQVWLTPTANVAGHVKMEELPDLEYELGREPVGEVKAVGHPLKEVLQ